MNKPFKSALNVQKGIKQPPNLNAEGITKLKSNKHKPLSAKDYFQGIKEGNRTILSKAITLVESSLPKHQELAEEIIGLCLKEAPGTRHQAPVGSKQSVVSIEHRASSIEHPASSIEHPASSIQHPASSIQHPASSIQHPASSIQHPASV